jgi:hypothetical protein
VVWVRIDMTRANGGGFLRAWSAELFHGTAFDFNGFGQHLAGTAVGDVGKFTDQRLATFLKNMVDARDNRAYFMITGAEQAGTYTYKNVNVTMLVDTGSAQAALASMGMCGK